MISPNVFNELMNRGVITNVGLNPENYKNIDDLQRYGLATGVGDDNVYMDVIEDISIAEGVLDKFFEAIAAGGNVVLENDIYITTADMINITKDVVLDLNGHSITKTGLTESGKCILFYVKGGNLTIKGDGDVNVNSGKMDVAIWSDNGSTVSIEGGNFHGVGNANGSDLIYAKGGKVNIINGSFKLDNMDTKSFATPQYSLLNAYGANVNNAKNYINVVGGSFYKFDPANNVSEGVNTSFVVDGYESIQNGDYFVVRETNDLVVEDEQ